MTGAVADGLLSASEARQAAIHEWFAALRPGSTVALSTHINADGDGCGSETALARLLAQRGIHCRIVNPTPWPTMFEFLLGDDVEEASARGADALADIDALIVLDINDVRRLGHLADAVRQLAVPVSVIDHHVAGDEPVGTLAIADTAACATGELVYDIAMTLGLAITPAIAQSLYAAILTDTGSFRFSNTSPRAHGIAAALLAAGVNPEEMYRRIYAQVSMGRLQLLREALGSLVSEPEVGLSYISVEAGVTGRYEVTSEELDGIVEHPRSIVGTRMALFFRDLGHGKVKVSLRSTGDVDVQQFARRYGGGGHRKASGAMLAGGLDDVRAQVVADARAYLRGELPDA
ncbi:bifunctional oligoribonuclease/PAP phosphatase NrnA [Gemmatimonas sp.]|jgi:phosphoesterase RecJ-like protein|uniref:bifunctional oligoribonuclease/PAP phosphatase NrnA n=1 Tax=Gemmatimonas sp. TaxID=1962908 RepID=UPI0037BFD842